MRMNVRVKGDNEHTIREALNNCDGISEFSELPLTPNEVANETAAELRKLEVEHTTLREQHGALQQKMASVMLGNKQLKQAIGKLDDLSSILIAAVAGNPIEPVQEHAALNMLAATVHKSQAQLAQLKSVMELMRKQIAQQAAGSSGDADSPSEG